MVWPELRDGHRWRRRHCGCQVQGRCRCVRVRQEALIMRFLLTGMCVRFGRDFEGHEAGYEELVPQPLPKGGTRTGEQDGSDPRTRLSRAGAAPRGCGGHHVHGKSFRVCCGRHGPRRRALMRGSWRLWKKVAAGANAPPNTISSCSSPTSQARSPDLCMMACNGIIPSATDADKFRDTEWQNWSANIYNDPGERGRGSCTSGPAPSRTGNEEHIPPQRYPESM